jgi:hypothetical protein
MDGVQSFGEKRAFRRTIDPRCRSEVLSSNEKSAAVTGLNCPRVHPENTRPWASWLSERDSNARYSLRSSTIPTACSGQPLNSHDSRHPTGSARSKKKQIRSRGDPVAILGEKSRPKGTAYPPLVAERLEPSFLYQTVAIFRLVEILGLVEADRCD